MSQNDFNVLSKRYQGACEGSKIAFLEATSQLYWFCFKSWGSPKRGH